MVSNDTLTFGTLLNEFRKQAHLTQQRLAEALGMHRHAVSRWEKGEVLPASKTIVLELARHLRLNDQEARRLLEASLTSLAPLWGVPFPRNLLFTGREETLEMLHQSITANRGAYALYGLGGVGKTQTVLEYIYRHALEYHALFWIEAETPEQVQLSLQRIADLLQLPDRASMDQQQMSEAIHRWLAAHDQWLLIWDNLEDLELPSRLFPPGPQGTLLITTHHQALGTLAHGIDLGPLEQEEAILLLLRRSKLLAPEATSTQVQQLALNKPADYAAAAELVALLGALPLALDQAGAYLEETGCTLADYLHLYEQQRAPLLNRRGSLGGSHPQSVSATLMHLQERVEQEQEGAADLLRVCAFLHAEAIPEELFAAGAAHLGLALAPRVRDPLQFDLLLAALRNLSLAQRQAETHTLSLHRLVQVVLREQMEPAEERFWSERVIRVVNAAFPTGDIATWAECERFLAQALACVPLITTPGNHLPEAEELLAKVSRYLVKRGRFVEAAPLVEQMIAHSEQQYGAAHPALITPLMIQAELAWQQGKYASAEELLWRVLAIEETHLEANHAQIAITLNYLALFAWEQGKYTQAETLGQQAQRVWERQTHSNHPEIAYPLTKLAKLYAEQGKRAQAEHSLQRVVPHREQRLDSSQPQTTRTLTTLAYLYEKQRKEEQAGLLRK
jgi:transcriptional regulator with XRE-family HTH domain